VPVNVSIVVTVLRNYSLACSTFWKNWRALVGGVSRNLTLCAIPSRRSTWQPAPVSALLWPHLFPIDVSSNVRMLAIMFGGYGRLCHVKDVPANNPVMVVVPFQSLLKAPMPSAPALSRFTPKSTTNSLVKPRLVRMSSRSSTWKFKVFERSLSLHVSLSINFAPCWRALKLAVRQAPTSYPPKFSHVWSELTSASSTAFLNLHCTSVTRSECRAVGTLPCHYVAQTQEGHLLFLWVSLYLSLALLPEVV
jgi:hypothetical protein